MNVILVGGDGDGDGEDAGTAFLLSSQHALILDGSTEIIKRRFWLLLSTYCFI